MNRSGLFAIVAVVIALAVLEAFFRVTRLGREKYEDFYTDIYDVSYRLRPGAENPWSGIRETLNDQGFRGENVAEKSATGFRVITVGDSCAFGHGVEADETFSHYLQGLLRDRFPKRSIDVINAGMPGTNFYQHVLFFQSNLIGFDPDLVLIYSGPNYMDNLRLFRLEEKRRPFLRLVHRGLRRSAVYRYLLKKIKAGPTHKAYFEIKDSRTFSSLFTLDDFLEDYEEDVLLMSRLARERGFFLIFLNYPSQLNMARKDMEPPFYNNENGPILARLSSSQGFGYVDIITPMKNKGGEGLFLDEIHPTPEGHRIIAEVIFREILSTREIVAGIEGGNR